MRFSNFNLYAPCSEDRLLVRNTRTGGVVELSRRAHRALSAGDSLGLSATLAAQLVQTGILVEDRTDEFHIWDEQLQDARNKRAELFTLHFIPTIQCQLKCGYCFENGVDRGRPMPRGVFEDGVAWMDAYFQKFPEIKRFKLAFFGGEPLLRKDLVLEASKAYQEVAGRHGLDFWVELITNGELLDLEFARELGACPWRRVQITLDGERAVHNMRRPGNNGRDVFTIITSNIRSLLASNVLPYVDIRLSFDLSNADSVIRVLDELAGYGDPKRVRLTLGFITDTFDAKVGAKSDTALTEKALQFWSRAKALGFDTPAEHIAGPLCVATAKHSAVFTPDGGIQKCFATAGRKKFDFGTVHVKPVIYTKDRRFEQWKRMDECIAEKCPVLPICGGGCPNDAMIAAGGPQGAANRFCQKEFLMAMNEGLLRIAHG